MDIHITYEALFDIVRKERSLNELQTLDKEFWMHVLDYIKDKESENNSAASMSENEKMRLQLQNVKRILKEIYEKRETKLMNLALNVVRTDASAFIDTRNMLKEEKQMFNELVSLLKAYKTSVLENVFKGEAPDISKISGIQSEIKDALNMEIKTVELPKPIARPVQVEEKEESSVENEIVMEEPEDTKSKVKFITSVPKFLGKNKDVFGPFNEGDEAELPGKIASILLKKGKVEAI